VWTMKLEKHPVEILILRDLPRGHLAICSSRVSVFGGPVGNINPLKYISYEYSHNLNYLPIVCFHTSYLSPIFRSGALCLLSNSPSNTHRHLDRSSHSQSPSLLPSSDQSQHRISHLYPSLSPMVPVSLSALYRLQSPYIILEGSINILQNSPALLR
jgi:hypothetical protein